MRLGAIARETRSFMREVGEVLEVLKRIGEHVAKLKNYDREMEHIERALEEGVGHEVLP